MRAIFVISIFLTFSSLVNNPGVSGQRVAPGVPPQHYDPNYQVPSHQQPQYNPPQPHYQQQQYNPPPNVNPGHYQQANIGQQQYQPQVPQVPVQHQPNVQQQQQVHVQHQQQQLPVQHQQQQMPAQQAHGGGGHHDHHGAPQQVLHTGDLQMERDHIAEHMEVPIDTSKMSDQELQFHYFKMHDADNNNKLDGCELIKSLIHWHAQGSKENHQDQQVPQVEEKIFTDDELNALIDPILQSDDLNHDGYIDYPEFIRAQQKSAANNQNR